VADALAKKGIKITANYVATLKSQAKRKRKARKAAAAPVAEAAKVEPAPAVSEAPAKAINAVTLDQIKMVGQMVKTIGGFKQLHDMLGVIKEVGGVKKFKDLLEAMAVGEGGEGIPF
jgi:hypothetical protein